jgi:hypothetical protein
MLYTNDDDDDDELTWTITTSWQSRLIMLFWSSLTMFASWYCQCLMCTTMSAGCCTATTLPGNIMPAACLTHARPHQLPDAAWHLQPDDLTATRPLLAAATAAGAGARPALHDGHSWC